MQGYKMSDNSILQKYIEELNIEIKDFDSFTVDKKFKELINLEKMFSKKLRKISEGQKVYADFVKEMRSTNRVDDARSYFRQRESDFISSNVSESIQKGINSGLYASPINFKFIAFAMSRMTDVENKIFPRKELISLFEKIKSVRNEIINNNLFLALGKAKIQGKSGGNSVDLSDLIQLANEGLIIAVDKYTPFENSVFAHMAVGRMIANFIDSNFSSSPVTINKSAKRKLYRIRKLLEKNPNMSRPQIAEILKVAEQQIDELIAISRSMSLDQPMGIDDDRTMGDVMADPDNKPTAYENTESRDLVLKLLGAYKHLNIIEQKILRLKGVNFMKTLHKQVAVAPLVFKHDTEQPVQTGRFATTDKLAPTLIESTVIYDSENFKEGQKVYFKAEIRNQRILETKYNFDGREFVLISEDMITAVG
jgi:DNA-directed RNA polymerase specialized sigma subunit